MKSATRTSEPTGDAIRAFRRDVPTLRIAKQDALLAEYHPGQTYTAGEWGGGERDLWIKSLRKGDVAVIARLDLLAEPMRKGGTRPTIDFATALAELCSRGAVVVDAMSGTRSDDAAKWPGLVRDATARVQSGHQLTPRRAKALGELSAAGTHEVYWQRADKAVIRARITALWHGAIGSDGERAEIVNAALIEAGERPMSARTMYRVFGSKDAKRRGKSRRAR